MHRNLLQGCVLSPILYSIYVSNLDDSIKEIPDINVLQFADDICLYASNKSLPKIINTLERAVNQIADVFDNLGLSLAPEKSRFCIFNRTSPRLNPHQIVHTREKFGNSIAT